MKAYRVVYYDWSMAFCNNFYFLNRLAAEGKMAECKERLPYKDGWFIEEINLVEE